MRSDEAFARLSLSLSLSLSLFTVVSRKGGGGPLPIGKFPEMTCLCFVALNKRFFSLHLAGEKWSSRHVVTELSMFSKSQFYDLEIMCRERAAAARKEMDYWLAEAEEWARFRLSCDQRQVGSREVAQSTKLKS
jgi:hypothetical protein